MTTKILVIDDDQALCKLMAVTLREYDFQVITAFTGEDGLELYKKELPQLVLLDVAMPGMSGFEVASAIRELEQEGLPHPLIVIMTAHARSFAVSVGFRAQIDSYLTKPIPPADVVLFIQNLLAEQPNRQGEN